MRRAHTKERERKIKQIQQLLGQVPMSRKHDGGLWRIIKKGSLLMYSLVGGPYLKEIGEKIVLPEKQFYKLAVDRGWIRNENQPIRILK